MTAQGDSNSMSATHELLQRAIDNPGVLQWHTWSALAPGPALVVLGAVHGNEACGAHAIARAMDDLLHGRLTLARGRLTLVPVANPLAFGRNTREGERNLNRRFVPLAEIGRAHV
jgi:predicted deacylase